MTAKERGHRLEDIAATGRPGTTSMLAACHEFLAHPDHILTLYGRVGTGKTMAAQGVVNELKTRGLKAAYIRASDMLAYIREAYGSGRDERGPGANQRLREFADASVLVLDEFDKYNNTSWTHELMEYLIDRRHRLAEDHSAGTILVLNSDPGLQSEFDRLEALRRLQPGGVRGRQRSAPRDPGLGAGCAPSQA